jgi:hypothetical protein
MTVLRIAAWIALLPTVASPALAQADWKPGRLSDSDERLLHSLLKEFLFMPPADSTRVRIRVTAPG